MDGFTPAEQAAAEKLRSYYNDRVQTADNPGGFDGDGHLANFIPSLRDVDTVAQGIVRIAFTALSEMERLAAEQHIAALLVEGGPVSSVDGQTGVITTPQLPRVLAPANDSPAPGATATLIGGALVLSVKAFFSLYGGTQKSRQFQVATTDAFGTVVWDSGVQAGSALSVSLANAQATLTGGADYYFRARQTDANDFTSDWSSPTRLVFPRAPSAPTMTAPANGATGQGAGNTAIAFAASGYAHPNNVARASRAFEISTTATFAAIAATVLSVSGSSMAELSAPKNVLQPDTLYYVRCRDTDANGGTNTSPATTFRTVTAFRPNLGDPYQGGFFVGQINDGGTIFDLIVSPKSGGEATFAYQSPAGMVGLTSRTNGFYSRTASGADSSLRAARFCRDLSLNGYQDWYAPAIDELELAYRSFKPGAVQNLAGSGENANSIPAGAPYTAASPAQTSLAAFRSGGAEAFAESLYWTSTEFDGSNACRMSFSSGNQGIDNKTIVGPVRAFRRVAA